MSAVHHLFLSQSTRVTDGQNCDSQDRANIDAPAAIKFCVIAELYQIVI